MKANEKTQNAKAWSYSELAVSSFFISVIYAAFNFVWILIFGSEQNVTWHIIQVDSINKVITLPWNSWWNLIPNFFGMFCYVFYIVWILNFIKIQVRNINYKRKIIGELFFGLFFGMGFGIIFGIVSGIVFGLFFGAVIGLVFGLFFGIGFELGSRLITKLHNGVIVGLIMGFVLGILSGLFLMPVFGLSLGLIIGTVLGTIIGVILGFIAGIIQLFNTSFFEKSLD